MDNLYHYLKSHLYMGYLSPEMEKCLGVLTDMLLFLNVQEGSLEGLAAGTSLLLNACWDFMPSSLALCNHGGCLVGESFIVIGLGPGSSALVR